MQARLRAEVRELRKRSGPGNDDNDELPWDYDALMRLPYLDAIVRETLRLHGPVSWIWRMCVLRSLRPLFVWNILSERHSGVYTSLPYPSFSRCFFLLHNQSCSFNLFNILLGTLLIAFNWCLLTF